MSTHLPDIAYARHITTGTPIMIRRGECGYHPLTGCTIPVEHLNRQIGVTPQQAAAMLAGSICGWDIPAADPRDYTENEARFVIGLPVQETAVS